MADARVEQRISIGLADAMLKFVDKRTDVALQAVNELVQNYPDKALAYLSRALIYTNTQQTDQAIADYTKTVELDPQNTDAYYNRAFLY